MPAAWDRERLLDAALGVADGAARRRRGDRHQLPVVLRPPPPQGAVAGPPAPGRLRRHRPAVVRPRRRRRRPRSPAPAHRVGHAARSARPSPRFTIGRVVSRPAGPVLRARQHAAAPPAAAGRPAHARAASATTCSASNRLEANKRPDLVVGGLLAARSGVRGVVAGTGSMRPSLRGRDRRGRWPRAGSSWPGSSPTTTSCRCWPGASAVVYAPYDEDYGYVTLQAFLAGKPVITTTDAGGVLEWVEHEVTGLVAEPTPGVDRRGGRPPGRRPRPGRPPRRRRPGPRRRPRLEDGGGDACWRERVTRPLLAVKAAGTGRRDAARCGRSSRALAGDGRGAGAPALPAAARRGAGDRPQRRARAARRHAGRAVGRVGRARRTCPAGWSRSGTAPGRGGVVVPEPPGGRGALAADRPGRAPALAAAPRAARRVGGAGRVGAAPRTGRPRWRCAPPPIVYADLPARARPGHAGGHRAPSRRRPIGAGDEVRGAAARATILAAVAAELAADEVRAARLSRLARARAERDLDIGRPAAAAARAGSVSSPPATAPADRVGPHLAELGCRPGDRIAERAAAAVSGLVRGRRRREPPGDRRPLGGAPAKLAGDGRHRRGIRRRARPAPRPGPRQAARRAAAPLVARLRTSAAEAVNPELQAARREIAALRADLDRTRAELEAEIELLRAELDARC